MQSSNNLQPHADPEVQILRNYDASAAEHLRWLFFNDKKEKFAKWNKLFEDRVFQGKYDLTLDQERDLAYARIKRVCDENLVSIFDFQHDPKNIFLAHEMLAGLDGSLATKFTVQFNLFGGSLHALHTERHLPLMKGADSLKNMGCFCFTELGYGNNAPKMETTAHYDEASQTFTIHSPSIQSQKYWITNGACHANWAIVFAQTIVKGKNEGLNGFLVQVRDEKMQPCKGVMIEDMGVKMGLNGIDNGRLMFEHVKVPREAMLNKLNDVTADGRFISETKKPSNRFFKVADALLSGRLCISAMCLGGSKSVLYVACRYAQQRLGLSKNGKSETPIMSYQLVQNAIVPLIARTCVINMAVNFAKDVFANPKGYENQAIRIYCSVKTMTSWNFAEVGRHCRERLGGGSFLNYTQVPMAIEGSHSGMTAEGDNAVLMQKVVKDILSDLQKEQHPMPKMTKCPKRGIPAQKVISDLETLTNLIYYREVAEIKNISKELQLRILQKGQKFFDVWQYHLSDEIQNTAKAYAERMMLEASLAQLEKCDHPTAKEVLRAVIRLNCVYIVKQHLGWYLTNKVISEEGAQELYETWNQVVKDVIPHMNTILESWTIAKHEHILPPIARDYLGFMDKGEYLNLDSAGEAFNWRATGVLRAKM